MRWQELRERLAADPEYRQALARELPYRALALSVARLRGVHDLTQAEFAERVGTTQSVIARLESGRHAPNLKLLERVANAFDLDWHVTFTPHLPVRAASVAADMPHRGTELQQVLNPSVVAVRMEQPYFGSHLDLTARVATDSDEPIRIPAILLGDTVVIPRETLPARTSRTAAMDEATVTRQAALALAS